MVITLMLLTLKSTFFPKILQVQVLHLTTGFDRSYLQVTIK